MRSLLLLFALSACAQPLPVEGITHVAVKVSDAAAARAFYQRSLGLREHFEFNDQGRTTVAFQKVNDRQYIELYPGLQPGETKFMHVCFETKDIETVRARLAKAGLEPTVIQKGRAGNLLFAVNDPAGQVVEFLQYLPGSLHLTADGKPPTGFRISRVVVTAPDRAKAVRFWRDQLGFREIAPGEFLVPGPHGDRIALGAEHRVDLTGPELRDPDGNLLTASPPAPARRSSSAPPTARAR
jgi:catechol 2,3-dioxygenase-like lactoylglutathione lyase family enzyme